MELNGIDILQLKKKLADNCLFRNSKLTPSDFEDLKIDFLSLEKGAKLYRLKDPAQFIYLVIEGEIKLLKKHSSGKNPPVIVKNNFFGHEDFFLNAKRSSAAFASENSILAALSRENFDALQSRDNSILNNISDSINSLNPASKPELQKIINGLYTQKNPEPFPPEITEDDKESAGLTEAGINCAAAAKQNPEVDVNSVCSGINRIVNNISENLSHLDNEKNKLSAAVSDYESRNKELIAKIKDLEELEKRLKNYEEEKNKILESRDCRINELEAAIAKYKEAESENLKKISSFSDLENEYKNNIKALEEELKEKTGEISKYEAGAVEKESIISGIEKSLSDRESVISGLEKNLAEKTEQISKLQGELELNLKTASDLNEELIKLQSRKDDQEKQASLMESEIKDLKKKIESLEIELGVREKDLNALTSGLEKKNNEISGHMESLRRAEAEVLRLKETLESKDEGIQSLSALVEELQKQIDEEEADKKEKDECIHSQSSKLSEYEESLNNLKVEVAREQQFINNFIEEIGELSANVWQKQSEIQEQNKIISEFQKKAMLPQDNSLGFADKEEEFRKISSDLNSERETMQKVRNELAEIKSDLEEYKNLLFEKDTKIEKQNEEFEELKHTNSALTDSLNSITGNYQKEIKRKEGQIAELKEKIEKLEKPSGKGTPDAKSRTVKTKTQAEKKADQPPAGITAEKSKELIQSVINKEVFSNCRLVAYTSADRYSDERSFEHYQYSALDIINVNLSRATMEAAPAFNKFIDKIISRERNKIIVNLLSCEYMDTSILGVLINSLKKAMSFKGVLVLVWQHQKEFSMLSLSKMNNIFRIFPNVQNALNSLS